MRRVHDPFSLFSLILSPTGRGFGYPTSFSDSFDRADGAPGNDWSGGSIVSNALVITPSYGAERHTDSNAASDPNGNEANATTGWGSSSCTLSSSSVGAAVGTYALKGVATATSFALIDYDYTATLNGWYRITMKVKRGAQGTGQIVRSFVGVLIPSNYSVPSTSYSDFLMTNRCTATNSTLRAYAAFSGGTIGDEIYVDNVSIKPITFSTCLVSRECHYPLATFGAKFTRAAANVQFGVGLYVDASNYVLAYNDGAGTVKLDKVVGGTLTAVTSAAASYSAGAVLSLHHKTGNAWDVAYNGSTVISNASITDSVFASASLFVLFATDSSVTIDDASFVAD